MTVSVSRAPTPVRLTKQDRREQLLDAAAAMLAQRGDLALTMEGLAARAGVSKALPYAHFDNSDAVLVALYQREMGLIVARVLTAVDTASPPRERLTAAIVAYFGVVRDRGPVLAALTVPGSRIPAQADSGARAGVSFVADLLVEIAGVPRRRARLHASALLGLLAGAIDAWAHGDASRSAAQDLVIQWVTSLVDAHS